MEDDQRTGPPEIPEPPWIYRGQDLSRILALSDGVFAFAMTLLVLGLVLPPNTTGGAVRTYFLDPSSPFRSELFAYIVTFFVIGLWWRAHHLIFGYIRQYDRVLVRANSVFLVTIAILPFATIALTRAGQDPIGVEFFAGTQIAAGLSLAGTWRYASGRGRLVHDRVPAEWRDYLSRITLVTPVAFALSIPVAIWIPSSAFGVTAGEYVWLGAFILPMAFRHKAKAGAEPPRERPPAPA
ncbi:MAG: DUF1211 domain-containing protein [Thermoplasmata archaeon]|nr:DUF1211 domain-containing protein [Thermoplasmata archaeon]